MKNCASGVLIGILSLTACGTGADSTTAAPPSVLADQTGEIQDMWDKPPLEPVEPGTYFLDPDLDPSTPLRVVYHIESDGWSMWAGAVKFSGDGHVGMSITTVDNLVTDGCTDHNHADPPIGTSVDALVNALANLAPFEVTSAPDDVTVYGYSGKHLQLTVPDLAIERDGAEVRFSECRAGQLKSWVAPFDTSPSDAFYGYTGPGYTEEFWILDVEGTRLMIAAERSAGSLEENVEELQAILDSIRIEP